MRPRAFFFQDLPNNHANPLPDRRHKPPGGYTYRSFSRAVLARMIGRLFTLEAVFVFVGNVVINREVPPQCRGAREDRDVLGCPSALLTPRRLASLFPIIPLARLLPRDRPRSLIFNDFEFFGRWNSSSFDCQSLSAACFSPFTSA